MILFPEGTLRRRVVEAISRALGYCFYGDHRMLSTHVGNSLKDGSATPLELSGAAVIDIIALEFGHCFKNAGKL